MPREKRKQFDMFNDFQFLSRRVQRLGGIVQNEGVECDEEGLLEWIDEVNDVMNDLNSLREDVVRFFQD